MANRWTSRRWSRRRTLGIAGAGAGATLFAAACGNDSEESPSGGSQATAASGGSAPGAAATVAAPRERKALTFADGFEPKSYVENGGHSGGVFSIREGIGEGLFRVNFESKFEPALATGAEQIDETTWRIAVRPNVTFHNGQPVNGEAVAYTLNTLAADKAVSAAFRGATASAADANNVTVKTQGLVPYMQAILADGLAVVYERGSLAGDPATSLPSGTGPFKLTAFRPGDRRVLEPNDAYWGGRPGVGTVQYLLIPEAQTRANQMRTGSVDIARLINPPDVPALKSNNDVQVLTQPLPRLRALYLNMTKRPTSDLRVRQAIAHAIERQPIIDTVLEGQSSIQTSLFRKELPWGQDLKGLAYDPNRAKALLEQAGYTAQNPLALTLVTYSSRAELPDLAQVLQQQFKKVNIDAKLQVEKDNTVWEPAAKRGEIEMLLVARNPLFLLDPQSIFESDYTPAGSYYISTYTGIDEQVAAAGRTADTQRRYAIYRQLEKKIIEDDVNTIVLNSYIQIDATRKNISGYRPHPTDAIALNAGVVKA